MIETIYRVGNNEFKSLEEAKAYEAKTGFKMYNSLGVETNYFEFVDYIITSNEEQNDYIETKYNILLPGRYGFYIGYGTVWTRVPNEVVEEIARRFK